MNFALSQPQHRTDRHPVGLLVVVGLHLLAAAAMLTARLHTPPAPPQIMDMKPIDQAPKPPKPVEDDKLPPPKQEQLKLRVVIPVIETDHPDAIKAAEVVDDKPIQDPPLVVIADAGPPARREVPHVTAHRAVVNAGAAQCRPAYPAAAQRAGAQGTSRIRFTVDALGHILGAQILQASGTTREHRQLDKAAADALAQCPVTPGNDEDGHPVGGTADVEYHWTLN